MAVPASNIQGSLRDYLQIIFHRRWFFIMPFIIVFFTATIGIFFLPKYYKSSILILVEEEKPVNPLARETPYLTPTGQQPTLAEQLKTLTGKIVSYPHLITLVKTVKINTGVTDPLSYEKLVLSIRKRIDVRMMAPDIFQISYEDKDPVLSRKIVDNLVKIFINENVSKKTSEAETAIKFAEEQAKLYKQKLEESEKALYEFKSKYPLQVEGREADFNVSMLTNYQTALTGIEMSMKDVERRIGILKRQLAGQEPVVISSDMMDLNPEINSLNQQLQELQSKLAALLLANPNSADVLSTQLSMEEIRERLRLEMEKTVDSETAQTAPLFYQRLEQKLKDAQKESDELKARQSSLSKLVKEYEGKIETLPEQEKEFARLMRDRKVNENIYEMLRVKVEENRLTAQEVKEKGTKYTILENARLPLKPSKPEVLLTGIVAFILGVLSGFGCVFMAELWDHSFRGIEDAKLFLDLPILGGISNIVDRNKLMIQKARQRSLTVFILILYVVSFIIAATISNIRQAAVTNKVIEIANKEKAFEAKDYGK